MQKAPSLRVLGESDVHNISPISRDAIPKKCIEGNKNSNLTWKLLKPRK